MHDDENEYELIPFWDTYSNERKEAFAYIWICPNCFNSQFSLDELEKSSVKERLSVKFDWKEGMKAVEALVRHLNKEKETDYKIK